MSSLAVEMARARSIRAPYYMELPPPGLSKASNYTLRRFSGPLSRRCNTSGVGDSRFAPMCLIALHRPCPNFPIFRASA